MDYTLEDEVKAPKPFKIFGKIVKWVFISFVIIMILWFGICGIFQKGSSKVKKYIWTEETAQLYKQNGKLDIWKLTAYNKPNENMELTEKLFFIDNLTYTTETSQFQFMLRYNILNEEIKKFVSKSDSENPFVFVLKDNKGNTYTEYQYIEDSALIYGYYRIVFSNIDIKKASELSLYVYCNSGDDIKQSSFVDICVVWYTDGYKEEYKLSSSEKKAQDKDIELKSFNTPLISK